MIDGARGKGRRDVIEWLARASEVDGARQLVSVVIDEAMGMLERAEAALFFRVRAGVSLSVRDEMKDVQKASGHLRVRRGGGGGVSISRLR